LILEDRFAQFITYSVLFPPVQNGFYPQKVDKTMQCILSDINMFTCIGYTMHLCELAYKYRQDF